MTRSGMPRHSAWRRARGGSRRRQWDVLLAIGLGSGLGSAARYGVAQAFDSPVGGFPWATFFANVSGSLVLGLLMVYLVEVRSPSRYPRPFLGVGLVGGYTTFSTYMVETHSALRSWNFSQAGLYVLASLVAGLAAVWTGIVLARWCARRPPRHRTGEGGAPDETSGSSQEGSP